MSPKDILSLMNKRQNLNSTVNKVNKPAVIKKRFSCKSRQLSHNFDSLGTHCVRYISPGLREQIKNLDNSTKYSYHIASFDLDDTLVRTKSGMKFAKNSNDWQFLSENIYSKLEKFVDSQDANSNIKRIVVIFTNQGGVTNTVKSSSKSLENLLDRLFNILMELRKLPLIVYASTKKGKNDEKLGIGSELKLHNLYRKPQLGMWNQLLNDIIKDNEIDLRNSFYVGDAAGRKQDFSDSDLKFAENIGIPFKLPEEWYGGDDKGN